MLFSKQGGNSVKCKLSSISSSAVKTVEKASLRSQKHRSVYAASIHDLNQITAIILSVSQSSATDKAGGMNLGSQIALNQTELLPDHQKHPGAGSGGVFKQGWT